MTTMATGMAPKPRTTSAASISDVPRVTVSSVTTTRSPGSSAPAMRPVTPWSLASLRMLKLRSGRPRVAATAAIPNATGSAPIVSPPMAVASGGMTSRAASATSRIPSGRHAVCFVSRNHELRRPDFNVNSPRRTECSSTWRRNSSRSTIANVTSAGMQLRIFTEPQQGASYDDLLAVAKATEDLGFDAFFRSDHFLKMGDVNGLPGPSDSWVVLAGLARETTRIRLGTLVTSATFRLPGPLAAAVAGVDQMSGGRVELGLGAGWYEDEHRAYGIPFPPLGERFDRLEEQLAIITGIWATAVGERFNYAGRYYTLVDSPALPKPVQQPLPIIVGGLGPSRTPRLAAVYAAEFNSSFAPVEFLTGQVEKVRTACGAVGRDPSTMIVSSAQVVCCGRDEAEVARRARAIGRQPDELRQHGVAGTVDEVVAKLRRFGDAGVTRVYLQLLDLHDLEHLQLLAEVVAPAVA